MNKKTASVLGLFAMGFAFGQTDSLSQKSIEEVVVTGQFSPQSINKSIYKVEVIDTEQIKNMAATNVAEVLNQNLNMLVVADSSSGNSYANILGLGGEYTKVLIDNIPVVNDEGLGNLVDLTKINLNNIERIEILRGSMGVEYGTNAVAGVINIITKKGAAKTFSGNVALQEETVGNNYDWYKKGNGRHVQSANLGYNINKNWYVSADINHNDFQGFEGNKKGYRFFSESENGLRGYDWQPKDQINANGIIRYSKNKTSIYYKASLLAEEINYRNPNTEVVNYPGGDRSYIARDKDYFTKRWLHQLNIMTKLGSSINYMGDFSYQSQIRQAQNYVYDVPQRLELSRESKQTFYDIDVFYSRGMFSHFLDNDKFDFQLGYELDRTQGYASMFTEDRTFGSDIFRTVFNYSNFLSAEWNALPHFYVRPGVRLALSDMFEKQYNYSLILKYSAGKSDFRLSGGSANRFPKYEELFTYYVDANHDVRGNANLKPEEGLTIGAFWDFKTRKTHDGINLSLSGLYLDLKNRIELAVVNFDPYQYQYINIDQYRSLMFNGSFSYKKGSFLFNTGASLTGISRILKAPNAESPDQFFFYPEVNASVNYKLSGIKTLFALYYKYSGESTQYRMESDVAGNTTFTLGKIGNFSMMNATVSQPFFNDHLDFTVGVKNIFDVTNIQNTTQAGDGHNANNTMNLFYGRSYFARVTYNF